MSCEFCLFFYLAVNLDCVQKNDMKHTPLDMNCEKGEMWLFRLFKKMLFLKVQGVLVLMAPIINR